MSSESRKTLSINEIQAVCQTLSSLSESERTAWYERNNTDSRLRREVEALIRRENVSDRETILIQQQATDERDTLIGTYVGPYEVLSLIGIGGMGSVYHARRKIPYEQEVALKVADLRLSGGAARFHEEQQVLADLHHPGIARLLDGGTLEDHRPYLVMEYVPGKHIDTYAELKKLRVMERVELWLQVCEAVASAHATGVIHRDLKPSNILVTEDRRVVVVDFGLARRWEYDTGLTHAATILGTPEYMAPEQASGKRLQTSPSTDVYSLGAVLYALLTGRPPFRAESPVQMVSILLHVEPVPPRKLNPAVPRDLDTICLKCLEKEPDKRYESAAQLMEDVKRLLCGEPVKAQGMGALSRGWRWAQRRPALASLIGLLLMTVLGSLVIITTSWRNTNHALVLAKQATDTLIDQAIEMANKPGMQRPQMEMLRKAIETYGNLLPALGDEPTYLHYFRARHELVCSYRRLHANAEALLESRQLLKDIEAYCKTHSSDDLSYELAQCYAKVCECLVPEDLQVQMKLITKAKDILENVTQRSPGNHHFLGLLAEKYTTLGTFAARMGSTEEAECYLNHARNLMARLCQYYPNDPLARIRYCGTLANYWDHLYFASGKSHQRLDLLEEAAKVDRSLGRDFPDRPDYRQETLGASARLANILEYRGDWAQAYDQALELATLAQRLMKFYPDMVRLRFLYGNFQEYLGELAFALGQAEASKQYFLESIQTYEELNRKHGVDGVFTLRHSQLLADCPILELRNGKRASELSRQCLDLLPQDARVNINQGRCLVRNGEHIQAQQVLQNALKLTCQEEEACGARLYLALSYAKKGQREQAVKELAATTPYMTRNPKQVVMLRLQSEVQQTLGLTASHRSGH